MKKDCKRFLLKIIISVNFLFFVNVTYIAAQVNETPLSSSPTNGIEPLKIISRPAPKYTSEARDNKIQGDVKLNLTFLETGKIGLIETVCGLPFGLTEEAIKAAQEITFEPAKNNNVPYAVIKEVHYNFRGDFGATATPNFPCPAKPQTENNPKVGAMDKILENSLNEKLVGCQDGSIITLQGFHLGMSVSEVLKKLGVTNKEIVPLVFTREDPLGEEVVADVGHSRLDYVDEKNLFPGSYYLEFRFYENKVYKFAVVYDGTIAWDGIKEYSESLGNAFNLPSLGWRYFDDQASKRARTSMYGYYEFCNSIFLFSSLSDLNKSLDDLRNGLNNVIRDALRKSRRTGQYMKHSDTGELVYFGQTALLFDNNVENRIIMKADEIFKTMYQVRQKQIDDKKKVFKP